MTEEHKLTPPADAKRVMRVADLPQDRSPARYEIRNLGEKPRLVTRDKRQRQILDLLIAGPVFCASPVRISDTVHIHKREIGLQVETTMYPGDPATGAGAYGIYRLISRVRRLDEQEAAA
ncbi:MAG: hypothetical protein AAGB10_23275 [Pseudomonadota bacterium]